MAKSNKQPWPTKAVMEQIYEQHLWGGQEFDFYSGIGSHSPYVVSHYVDVVVTFLKSHPKNLSVCDLGCGDFNIGKQLLPSVKSYIAIDIVDALIERNKTKFKHNYLEFQCLDIAKDDLPVADCVIIRQVFQHLSNEEIQSIVNKLDVYKYIILTEHIPNGDFIPNIDIIAGQGIRMKHNSGVDLLKAPFNLKVNNYSILNEIVLEENKGKIQTILYSL